MRRKDREIIDQDKIKEIIDNCDCCRLGFFDGKEIYIVPLSFGYVYESSQLMLYFHGAKEGRKIDLIQNHPNVGFEMDTNYQLHEGESACSYSARFDSIIGNGKAYMIENDKEKQAALISIMMKNTHKSNWEFSEAMLKSVSVFKVEVDTFSCKRHL